MLPSRHTHKEAYEFRMCVSGLICDNTISQCVGLYISEIVVLDRPKAVGWR